MTDKIERLGIDGLATAWLSFTTLADHVPEGDVQDALRLAGRISNSLSDLRSDVSEVIIGLAAGRHTTADAERELRRALEETAGGDHGR